MLLLNRYIILFAVLIFSFLRTNASPLEQRIKTKSINSLKISFQTDLKNRKTYLLSSDHHLIEGNLILTKVSETSEGEALMKSELFSVKSSFKNSQAAYGGHITATIDCESKKFIKEELLKFENQNSTVLMAVANQRKIFGVCAKEEIKHISMDWIYFNKEKLIVSKVRLFKPIANIKMFEAEQKDLLLIFKNSLNQIGGIK